MTLTLTRTLTLIAVASTLGLSAAAASATIIVKCETRANRSKASVDGKDLGSGMYTAVLTSGANSAQSNAAPTVKGEVEFDFDSNPRDIKKGATPIAQDFIVGGTATGSLLDASGNTVATKTVNCRAR